MHFAILAASVVVTAAALYAASPFKHDRLSDTVGFVVIGVVFLAMVGGVTLVAPSVALICAGICAVALPIAAFIHWFRLQHIARLTRAVINSHFRPSALRSLAATLENVRGIARATRARKAAWVIAEAGQYEAAESLLSGLVVPPLYAHQRALVANDLAAYRIRLGDVKGAREALSSARRPARGVEGALQQKDALLLALEGRHDAALAIADRVDPKKLAPRHRAGVLLARAHAHAGRGEDDRARDALRELAKIDPKWIDFATQPSGPASALAVAFAAEPSPYR